MQAAVVGQQAGHPWHQCIRGCHGRHGMHVVLTMLTAPGLEALAITLVGCCSHACIPAIADNPADVELLRQAPQALSGRYVKDLKDLSFESDDSNGDAGSRADDQAFDRAMDKALDGSAGKGVNSMLYDGGVIALSCT